MKNNKTVIIDNNERLVTRIEESGNNVQKSGHKIILQVNNNEYYNISVETPDGTSVIIEKNSKKVFILNATSEDEAKFFYDIFRDCNFITKPNSSGFKYCSAKQVQEYVDKIRNKFNEKSKDKVTVDIYPAEQEKIKNYTILDKKDHGAMSCIRIKEEGYRAILVKYQNDDKRIAFESSDQNIGLQFFNEKHDNKYYEGVLVKKNGDDKIHLVQPSIFYNTFLSEDKDGRLNRDDLHTIYISEIDRNNEGQIINTDKENSGSNNIHNFTVVGLYDGYDNSDNLY